MPYRIRVSSTTRRELRQLPGHVRHRAERAIEALISDPMPARSREWRGLPGFFRVPLLDWRIIYRIDNERQSLHVLTVRRKTGPETYEGLEEVEP